jgi:hypothetical protein
MSEISAGSVEGSKGFPKDADLFAHKAGSRNASSRSKGFTSDKKKSEEPLKLRGRIPVILSRVAHHFTPE